MRTARVQRNVDYLAHLEADLVRAERAVVLLRNLVEAENHRHQGDREDLRRQATQAARRYLADLDAADTDMV